MIKLLGAGFVALQAVDGLLTMWAVNHGSIEANPLMAGIAGSWLSPVVKVVPAALAVAGLIYLVKRFKGARICATIGLVAVNAFLGLVIASNIVEVI